MSQPQIISFSDGEALLDWAAVAQAIAAGHDRPKARIADSFVTRGDKTLLTRSAWIDGLGMAIKTATIFPGNPQAGIPAVNGGVSLFSDRDGRLEAILDFHLVTKWKTAADSVLAARRLARADARVIVIIGAGAVARSLVAAYSALFPAARFLIWNRTHASARALADMFAHASAVDDLAAAVGQADIVSAATLATTPVLRGAWLRPGTHVDLIGAYRADMREADDDVLTRGRLFVDSRETTLKHIGELADPMARGVISAGDIVADYYDMPAFVRRRGADITVFKNGGGAHLDLMVCRHILDRWHAR